MISTLCNFWDDFSSWVTVGWTDTTFAFILTAFLVLGLLSLLSFFKKNFNKGKKVKWFNIFFCALMFVCVGILCAARFA